MESNTTIENFNDVFFINPFEGWAAGTDVLLHSVDGGETWTEELESQTVGKELRAIYFTSANNGYVVGNGKTLLKYTGVATGVGVGQKLEAGKLKIYPNPVSKNLTIDLPESSNFYHLKMVNSTGQIMLLEESFSENEIDVSDLTTGIYFLTLQNSKEIYTTRFVKK
jgi:hypothetical protein